MSVTATSFYITGGTLQRDAACYVERRADADLYNNLLQGKFCYILTSRQMGKSSLMVRIALRLRQEAVAAAVLDLTAIGQNLNPEQWYNGLLTQLGQRLDLEDELDNFFYERKQLGPLQRWRRAIREVVLNRYSGRVIIFIDEADIVKSLPFSTDEFFAAIREFYNSRTEDPELERLTFCLLGVATPSDLIKDTRTTPFNIGERIELYDFTEAEAAPLARGLMREPEMARLLLERVLYWTGGHPYLTQRLCRAVAEDMSISSADGVDKLCERLFFSTRARERDDNLLFVRERMLRSEVDPAGLLEQYRRVYKGKRVMDDETNPLVSILRLSGITKVRDGHLVVRSRIYERVFNEEWVKLNMPDAEVRRQRVAFRRGLLRATAIAMVILAMMASLLFFAIRQRNLAEQQALENRRLLYVAQMNLAYQAWEGANAGRVLELLENQKPKPGHEDLRGFEWFYLWRLSHSELFTLQHKEAVDSVAFSPDGKILAVGIRNGVELWDLTNKQALTTLKGHAGSVDSVIFSHDGKKLAAGSEDGTVKLWDTATLQEMFTLKEPLSPVKMRGSISVMFSPNDQILTTRVGPFMPAPEPSTVRLWNVTTGKEIIILKGQTDTINSVAFSPDGKSLATVSGNYKQAGTVKLWNIATGKEIITLKEDKSPFTNVAFSPDGKILAVVVENTVRLLDINTKQELVTLKGHTDAVRSVAFSPDGKKLATGSEDRTVKLWDTASWQELTTIKGHMFRVTSTAFSPDSNILATGSHDKTVKLWDVLAELESTSLGGQQDGLVRSIAFSPDGKILATAGHNAIVKLWDVSSRKKRSELKGHTGIVLSVAFSPNGKTLATGSLDKMVKIWDVTTGQEIITLKEDKFPFTFVAFSPDGKTLATGGAGGTKLWDLATKKELATLHLSDVSSLAFSSNGKILATGSEKMVKLWDTATWQELATFKGHNYGSVYSVAFSPDGKNLVTGSQDTTVKIWDVATRQEVITLKGHADAVTSIAFSPDGKRLVTAGSVDRMVKIWDVATRQELIALKGDMMGVFSVMFSPDGKKLATGGVVGTKLWRSATEEEALAKSKQ